MINFLKSFFNLIKYINLDSKQKKFVFFSETFFYKDHFVDLMNELKKNGEKKIIFITNDEKNYIYFQDKFKSFLIKNNLVLKVFFQILECKFLICTLTDIGNNFVKSKKCEKYIYFFHALSSTHKNYTAGAFNNYDLILTTGKYQKKEIRAVEEEFNLKKKEIINTGYFYLDNLRLKIKKNEFISRQILFAPSWNYNKNNLFDDYSFEIIKVLLDNNFKVILRPHPEHYKRSKKTISKIKKNFEQNINFSFDKFPSNLHSMEKSQILITDNSGIVFEYLFLLKRPVIFLEYKDKIHNTNLNKIKIEIIDNVFKEKFGNLLNISEIEKLNQLCENLIIKKNFTDNEVEDFENKMISNIGNSYKFATKVLLDQLNSSNK